MASRAWWLVFALVGCVQPGHVLCKDGRVCPETLSCDEANHGCVLAEQLVTCVGMEDGATCPIDGADEGVCSLSVCVATRCGDGLVTGLERCDGLKLGTNDTCDDLGFYSSAPLACTADCVYKISVCGGERCGDTVINGPEFCEQGKVPANTNCVEFGYDTGAIGCATSCTPEFDACQRYGFVPPDVVTTRPFTAVWGAGPNAVFAVGDGIVARYDGTTWTQTIVGPRLRAVFGSSATDVWAVGEPEVAGGPGAVLHLDGTQLIPSTIAGVGTIFDVWAFSPTNAYAVGGRLDPGIPGGFIAHWNGTSWSAFDPGFTPRAVFGTAANAVYVAGSNGSYTRWNGATWSTPVQIGTADIQDIWARGPDDVYLAASTSVHHVGLATSMPVPLAFAAAREMRSLWGDAFNVYIASAQGVGVHDGAVTPLIDAEGVLLSLWGTGVELWGVTEFGSLRRFAGTGWLNDQHSTLPSRALAGDSTRILAADAANVRFWNGEIWASFAAIPLTNDLSIVSDGTVYVVGGESTGFVKRKLPADSAFVDATAIGNGSSWQAVWAASATDAVIVGDAKSSHLQNMTGTPIPGGGGADLRSLWGSSASNVYAAGHLGPMGGTLLRFTGSGAWSNVTPTGSVPNLNAVWGTSATDILIAGEQGYVARFDGTRWTKQDLATFEPFTAIGGTGPSDIFVGGELGQLHHWNGTGWLAVRAPTNRQIVGIHATATNVFLATGDGSAVLLRRGP